MTQLLFRQCLAFVSDVLLSLFFFRALPPQILSVWKRIGLTLGGCLFLVPIYFRSGQSYAVVSFLLRGMFGAVLLCQKALLPRARAFSTLRVENSCKRTSVLINGLPVTAKANAQLHGFGLKNVKAVLEKYGGSLHVSQEESGVFLLTVLIPLP